MIQELDIEAIDRTIYEVIRLALVSGGHLPDITTIQSEADYRTAKETISASNVQLIEVFGVGSAEARDEKIPCRIVIDRKTGSIGKLGGYPAVKFEKTGTGATAKFKKSYLPESSINLEYDIRGISNSAKNDRIISNIIYSSLGVRRYLNVIEDYNVENDACFLLNFNGDADTSSTEMKERMFRYVAMDIWIKMGAQVIRDNIAALTSINFQVSIAGVSEKIEDGFKAVDIEIKP